MYLILQKFFDELNGTIPQEHRAPDKGYYKWNFHLFIPYMVVCWCVLLRIEEWRNLLSHRDVQAIILAKRWYPIGSDSSQLVESRLASQPIQSHRWGVIIAWTALHFQTVFMIIRIKCHVTYIWSNGFNKLAVSTNMCIRILHFAFASQHALERDAYQ